MSELPVKSACIFCNIVNRLDPTELLYEDQEVCVFRDIRPASRLHVLAIPKKHIQDSKVLTAEHKPLVEKLLSAAKAVLTQHGLTESDARFGYHWPPFRTVHHLHLHAIAPESEMGFLGRMIFKKDSYWFVSKTNMKGRGLMLVSRAIVNVAAESETSVPVNQPHNEHRDHHTQQINYSSSYPSTCTADIQSDVVQCTKNQEKITDSTSATTHLHQDLKAMDYILRFRKRTKKLNYSLVEKLLLAAKTVVCQHGLAVPDTLFGYHQPPFCTVYHLHLHAIAPEREMSQYSRMMFPKNTYSFVSPEYVASRLL